MQHGSFSSPQQHFPCFLLMSLYPSLCIACINAFYCFALINTCHVSMILSPHLVSFKTPIVLTEACCCFLSKNYICWTHIRFVNFHFHTSLKRITPTNAREQAVSFWSTAPAAKPLPVNVTAYSFVQHHKYTDMCHNIGSDID